MKSMLRNKKMWFILAALLLGLFLVIWVAGIFGAKSGLTSTNTSSLQGTPVRPSTLGPIDISKLTTEQKDAIESLNNPDLQKELRLKSDQLLAKSTEVTWDELMSITPENQRIELNKFNDTEKQNMVRSWNDLKKKTQNGNPDKTKEYFNSLTQELGIEPNSP